MADIQLNSVTLASESGGTVTVDSAVAGIPAAGITGTIASGVTIPAAGVTGVLPVGVTGGSGLTALNATNITSGTLPFARLGTGAKKLLWRNSTGPTGVTHSTSWVYMTKQILGTVPTTTNYLLMEVSVRYRIEYNCNGIGVEICLDNSGSAPSVYDTADHITPTNWSSLADTNGSSSYMMSNINPFAPAYTAIVHHYEMTFMFDGSSQFHANTNYVYLAAVNMTGSGSYTRSDTTIHSVTMWEIQK